MLPHAAKIHQQEFYLQYRRHQAMWCECLVWGARSPHRRTLPYDQLLGYLLLILQAFKCSNLQSKEGSLPLSYQTHGAQFSMKVQTAVHWNLYWALLKTVTSSMDEIVSVWKWIWNQDTDDNNANMHHILVQRDVLCLLPLCNQETTTSSYSLRFRIETLYLRNVFADRIKGNSCVHVLFIFDSEFPVHRTTLAIHSPHCF